MVTITGGGTGAGITAAGEGRSEIAMASREIKDSERKLYSKNNFQQFFIGYDGVCIVVSKQIYDAGVKSITKDQLKQSTLGKITNWKDLKGPDAEIYAIGKRRWLGNQGYFQ